MPRPVMFNDEKATQMVAKGVMTARNMGADANTTVMAFKVVVGRPMVVPLTEGASYARSMVINALRVPKPTEPPTWTTVWATRSLSDKSSSSASSLSWYFSRTDQGKVMSHIRKHGAMYAWDGQELMEAQGIEIAAVATSRADASVWHARLGHIWPPWMRDVARIVDGVPDLVSQLAPTGACGGCACGKMSIVPFAHQDATNSRSDAQ
ncbi:unnamed protein product [Phytophthora fragariaefolia]|uniref:Unnamed protein product n=1 Tax=Phytophthora fragariaefolia TaxID=1490495 RepID=A0A9W7CQU4_9STRA|nr:unnamed protein product [Phytophthora fragariaefolia]